MKNNILSEIVSLCYSLDEIAYETYSKFSNEESYEPLKMFWKEMALEEQEHLNYWKEIIELERNNCLPQIFDNPAKVKKELQEIYNESKLLVENKKNISEINRKFVIAYHLEFLLLHQTIEAFFQLLTRTKQKNPEDNYKEHIDKFIDSFNKFGVSTVEMQLLGKTIKELWYNNKRIVEQSNYDALTMTLNRRGFKNTIIILGNLAKREKYNISVMMLDIDHFKKINDNYGHKAGDTVLKKVANIIKKNVRVSDIVGRYGGEEFIIFLSDIDKTCMFEIAEKIRQKVEVQTKSKIPVTVSIGAITGKFKKNVEKEFEMFIKQADNFLYVAKRNGRNKVVIE